MILLRENSAETHARITCDLPALNLLNALTENIMSVVRLLGFATLTCGCVVGRYRDVGSTREIVYVEEKGVGCDSHAHRRNHTMTAPRRPSTASIGQVGLTA